MAKAKRANALSNVLGLKDEQKELKQVIDSFGFDTDIYEEVYDRSKPIRDSVKKGDEIIRTYDNLAQDMFMSLYKHKPKLVDEEDVTATHQFNRTVTEQLMQTDEFRRLRSRTRHDMINSALGFEILSNQAVTILNEYQAKMKAQNPDQPTVIDQINDQIDQQNGQGQGQGQGGPGAGTGAPGGGAGGGKGAIDQNMANQLAQQQNQMQPPQLDPQAMQDLLDHMNKSMQGAAAQALDEVSDLDDMLTSWGMNGGDPNNRITYEDKKGALQRLRKSDKLKDMSDLIGRMKKISVSERKERDPDGASSIRAVKTGDNIQAVLPSEKALLASKNKTLKSQFYRKYHQKELLEYDMEVYESKGKGPMTVQIDVSGSMQGSAEKWSKAVALALLEVAQNQKRNYACLHFNTQVVEQWEIPYGNLKPQQVFDIAEKFAGGGTSFEPPLQAILDLMNKDKFKKGDAVFITDGESGLRDSFLEEFLRVKAEKEFKVITVVIDAGGSVSDATVKKFSDKIIRLSDIAKMGESAASNIFRDVQP